MVHGIVCIFEVTSVGDLLSKSLVKKDRLLLPQTDTIVSHTPQQVALNWK